MEIVIPNTLLELLLIHAAGQESTVEEIVEKAMRKYIERNDENAV